jgi:hypothetical protein
VCAREWLDIEPSFRLDVGARDAERQLGDARLERENPERRRYRNMEVELNKKRKNPAVGKKKSSAFSFLFFPSPIFFLFLCVCAPFRVVTSFIEAVREHLGQLNELIKILAHCSRTLKGSFFITVSSFFKLIILAKMCGNRRRKFCLYFHFPFVPRHDRVRSAPLERW